jgi:hypothetical protein
MAQQDAMEQAKEFLRQVIKYRFWISIGVAAIFSLIAYMVGSSPIRAKADAQTKAIAGALTDVKQYTSNAIPTADYKPLVEEKTQTLDKDVHTAWKTLYDRQAPFLTWPETVRERFRKWGREWPKDEDAGRVNLAIVDYIMAYPDYVSMVYKTFNPFNYETGEGIVAAPPQDALLRPAVFQVEKLPNLGKVWSAQERLWIQRTVLDVVAQVNKNAKNWDDAIVKQIESLEVGNPTAQDQQSIAKGEQLEPAPDIYAPGEEEAAQAAAASAGGSGSMSMSGPGAMAAQMGGGGGLKGRGDMPAMGMAGMSMMGGGGMPGGEAETVSYVKPENDKGQYKIMPIMISVLIDQDHIQDFLIELENSPMSIQVKDMELSRPHTRVTKPQKGEQMAGGFGGLGGSMAGMMSRMRGGDDAMSMGRGMSAFGGMMGQMAAMRSRMGGAEMGGMRMGGMGMPGMGASTAARKGTDTRNVDRAKEREKAKKAIEEVKGPTLFDPHFDIVQVTVYGQARFFNPPPVEEQAQPSMGDTAAAGGAPAAAPAAAAPAASAGAAGGSQAPGASVAGSAQANQQTPQAAPAKAEPAPAAKAEPAPAAKADAAKADAAKADAAKADAAKADAAKADAAKPATTKGEAKGATPKS